MRTRGVVSGVKMKTFTRKKEKFERLMYFFLCVLEKSKSNCFSFKSWNLDSVLLFFLRIFKFTALLMYDIKNKIAAVTVSIGHNYPVKNPWNKKMPTRTINRNLLKFLHGTMPFVHHMQIILSLQCKWSQYL